MKRKKKIIIIIAIFTIISLIVIPNTFSKYTDRFTKNITLNMREPQCTVIFNKNNASATGTMANEVFDYGQTKALTTNSFEYTNYIFTGWNTESDGTGTDYADHANFTNTNIQDGATVTLYAQWELNTSYHITYSTGVDPIALGLPTSIMPGENLVINFGSNRMFISNVTMGDATTAYTYNETNNTLTVQNVSGNIHVDCVILNDDIEYVLTAASANDPIIEEFNAANGNVVTTATSLIEYAHLHAINGNDKHINYIKITHNYINDKGNVKSMRCNLYVDGSTTPLAYKDYQYAKGARTATNVDIIFDGLNINPLSMIYVTFEVVDANNDSITLNTQTITIGYANN